MSRCCYDDCCDGWDLIRWRGAVNSAIKGKRGQKLLRDLAAALDAMPVKRLIKDALEDGGEVCALGCLGKAMSMDMSHIDPEEPEQVAKAFGIAPAMAQEIEYINDEWYAETPEERWRGVRGWVAQQIKQP